MKGKKRCKGNHKKCKKQFLDQMFVCHKSKFGFNETIKKVKTNGIDHGWYAPEISNHYERDLIFGIEQPNKAVTISMSLPRYANKIIRENVQLASIMPIQINIYEENSEVFISWLNIEKLGGMFSNITAQTMQEAAILLMQVLKDIINTNKVNN